MDSKRSDVSIDMDSEENDVCIDIDSKGFDVCGNGRMDRDISTELIGENLIMNRMNKEKSRIESFMNWPKPWIDVRKLAKH